MTVQLNNPPDLSGLVPYVGATTNVNLGLYGITGALITATDKFSNPLTGHGTYDGFATMSYVPFGHYLNIVFARHDPWFCYLAGVYQPGDTSGYGLYAGDGTRYVYLADGTYAVNATGPSLFSGNVNSTGTITGTSLIKSGGTYSQFLKADGSVDGATYLTSYTETDPVVKAVNGIVKSDTTTISVAVAGVDYVAPTATTYTPAAGDTVTMDARTREHWITLPTSGTVTLSVSNAAFPYRFIVHFTNPASGSCTLTWFTTILWPGGTTPVRTTTVSKQDEFSFVCKSSNTYNGYSVGFNW